jgi:hypothetical protein
LYPTVILTFLWYNMSSQVQCIILQKTSSPSRGVPCPHKSSVLYSNRHPHLLVVYPVLTSPVYCTPIDILTFSWYILFSQFQCIVPNKHPHLLVVYPVLTNEAMTKESQRYNCFARNAGNSIPK